MRSFVVRVVAVLALVLAPAAVPGIATASPEGASTAPAELSYACALKSNGLVRVVSSPDECGKKETALTIKPGPVLLCIQPSGSTRYTTTFRNCRAPAMQVTLPPAAGTVFFCAAAGTGVLRYVTDPSECTADESPLQATPNDAAPAVASTSPATGASHVSTLTDVSFTMTEAVTLAADAVTLVCGGQDRAVSTTVVGLVVRSTPLAPLPEGAACTATLRGARVFDTDLVDPPDTMAADVTVQFTVDSAPALASSSPADAASGVALGADLVLTFTEPVTVPDAALSLVCGANPVTFTTSGSGTATVTLDPDGPLPATTSCGLTVTGSMVSDVDAGDPPDTMAANASISFTTVDEAPSVTSTTPADGAADVGAGSDLSVTFSEPVTAPLAAFSLACDGSAQALSVSAGPATTFTLTPVTPLPKGVTCTLTVVAAQVSDVDSVDPPDHPAADTSVSFTTSANSPPTAVDLAPRAVAENSPVGTVVGALTTTDADAGDTFTYTLVSGAGDADNALFAVDGGSLETAAVLDADAAGTRSVRVRSTDAAGAFVEATFDITVTDVNEAPSAPDLTGRSVDENQPAATEVGTLSATDPDAGQTLTYAVVADGCGGSYADGAAAFGTSGTSLRTATPLDHESTPSFEVCVRVTDSGSPALSADALFTVTVNDVNDPPSAVDDSYSGAVGNTMFVVSRPGTPAPRIAVTGTILLNDLDQDSDALSAVPETVTSSGGGTATIFSDGSFTFLPGVGDKGLVDSFTYRVSDGQATSQGTVSVTIGSVLVWWVDGSAAPGGDGRSTQPLAGLTTLNGVPATDPDGPDDTIFLRTGPGPYAGGLALEPGQSLVGDRAGLSVGGVELVAPAATTPVVTNSSGNGIDLANGVSVQGVDVSGASGDGIHGTAVATATVGTTAPVGVSSSGGDGLELSGAAGGQVVVAGTIAGSGGRSVAISGRTGGAVSISADVTGKGVELTSNTGASVSFSGALALTTTTTRAFSATGGGTVAVVGSSNTLASTTGEALVVENTTIGATGLSFRSVSANGAVNGIRLTNTGSAGSLRVTGGGSTTQGGDASGGTVRATTGPGILLSGTTSPSFNNVSVLDVPTAAGVRGSGVSGFSFTNGRVDGSGLSGTDPSSANLAFNTVASGANNLSGVVAVSNSVLANAYGSGFDVYNEAGTVSSLTLSNNLVQSGTTTTSSKGHGIIVQVLGSASTAAAVTGGGISGNTVRNFPSGGGIRLSGGNGTAPGAPSSTLGSSGSHLTVSGNTVRGSSDQVPMNLNCVYVDLSGVGSGFVDVTANGTPATPLGAARGTCISVNSTGAATLTSTLSDNVITPGPGQNSGGYGIAGGAAGGSVGGTPVSSAVLDVRVRNNSVSGVKSTGIYFVARDSATMRARVQDNTVTAPTESGGGEPGIQVNSGDSVNGDAYVCLAITGNVSAGSLNAGLGQVAPGIGLRKQGSLPDVNDFGVVGLTTSPAFAAATAGYVASVNPSSVAGGAAYGGLGAYVISGANYVSCTLPPE